jgi:aspartate carbamoyltransferase catalytic subunit
MPGLLTCREFSRSFIDQIIDSAARQSSPARGRHAAAVIGLAFFEDSLRTRVGFDVAAARLCARTTTLLYPRHSPAMGSPETVDDAIRSIAQWTDVLCLRHPDVEAVARVAALVDTPVINCGNGNDEHPTQALVDLCAIQEHRGTIDGLRIGLIGDLHAMRTAHSLALALSSFEGVSVRSISPIGLELPDPYRAALVAAGHTCEDAHELDVADLDVVYVAGLPADTDVGVLGNSEQERFHVTREVVGRLERDGLVLSPLPRVDEIDRDVDDLPQAGYFRQSSLGLGVRMAVLDQLLDGRGL